MKLVKPRELAQRSLGLVANVVSYVQASQAGTAPSPLLLLIRSANQLAERILDQPSPVATPGQRRTLLALSTQLRGHDLAHHRQRRRPRSEERGR